MEIRADEEAIALFTPQPMSAQKFALSGKTSADAYRAEVALVRMDDQIAYERIGPALVKIIARLEAMATIRIDGREPSLRTLIELEHAAETCTADDGYAIELPEDYFPREPSSKEASLEALRYLKTLMWLRDTVGSDYRFTPQTLLDIHSRCVYGKPAIQTGTQFRRRDYLVSEDLPSYSFYRPPAPEQVPMLIDDLCEFINKQLFSPNAQSGFAHFQFEGIKPFKKGMDRTGRAMCHAIFYQRGLVHDIIPPIGLLPAIRTRSHAQHLLPYDMGLNVEGQEREMLLDQWVRFCANSTELAAHVMQAYIETVLKIEENWNRKIGRVSRGSTIEDLLLVLPGDPVLTVASAMALTGRSFSTTDEALGKLQSVGILRVVGSTRAGKRIFEADEVFEALDEVDRHLLAGDPVARDSFFSRDQACRQEDD